MKIAVSGAGGFVGRHLVSALKAKGWVVVPLHTPDFALDDAAFGEKLAGADAVLHLAGATINRRWTEAYKKELYDSRVKTAEKIVNAMAAMAVKPKRFVCTSAVGIYASTGHYDEENAVYADDFLGRLVRDWESAALEAETAGVGTVVFRYGLVLGRDGGILQEMLPPFRFGLGGTIGDGKQAFSWVHIDDLVRAYLFVLEHDGMAGIYNLTAPRPTTNGALTKALGKVLHRPTLFAIPKLVLRLRFGSEAAAALSSGQYVLPKRLREAGFVFAFETVDAALEDLLGI